MMILFGLGLAAQNAGARAAKYFPLSRLAVMGLVEVVSQLPDLLKSTSRAADGI